MRIRELREDNDFNQEEVAKILNVQQATYSRYETGALEISLVNSQISITQVQTIFLAEQSVKNHILKSKRPCSNEIGRFFILSLGAALKAFPPQGGRCHGVCRDG